MITSASDFANILMLHRLVDPRQLEAASPSIASFNTGEEFARHLESLGLLSKYQSARILAGEASSLNVDNYRLIEPIGAGGMGKVFKAIHVRLKRLVAVKMISETFLKTADNPQELLMRFEREAQAAAQLLHPNIVTLFDYNIIAGVPFIAMEYVDGFDLAKIVKGQGPLSFPRACDYILQAATGLQHAHEAGMVHRDIKPHNLLVTRVDTGDAPATGGTRGARPTPRSRHRGIVKILDLGLARVHRRYDSDDSVSTLTMEGSLIGTPDFIAPEQARDATRVDIRADLYSLGCTFYYLVTGRTPFATGANVVETLLAHQNEEPLAVTSIRSNTPAEIASVIRKLMSKKPEDRYQTPADLIDELVGMTMELWSGTTKSVPEFQLDTFAADAAAPVANEPPPMAMNPGISVGRDPYLLPAKKIAILDGPPGIITSVAFSPGAHWLAAGDLSGRVRLWNLDSRKPSELPLDQNNCQEEIRQVLFGRRGRTLFACTSTMESKFWRWDLKDSLPGERQQFPAGNYLTSCHVVSPDGSMMAAGSGGVVLLYKLTQNKSPIVLRGHTGEIRALAFSPDGKRLYSADDNSSVIIWEPDRYWSKKRHVLLGHDAPVTSLAVANGAKLLASGSIDGTIRLWDASGDSEACVATLSGHQNGVRSVRFVAKSMLLLSMCERGNIFLWDAEERVKVRQWQSDKGVIHSMSLSPDGRFVATGLADGRVVIYDLNLVVEAGATASWAHAV